MTRGRTILITGGAGTLGVALGREAARRGWRVAVADLSDTRGEAARNLIAGAGAESFFIRCDVRREEQLRATVLRVIRRWGALDVLVNNAGVATAGLFETVSEEDWAWQLETNLLGAVRASRVAVSEMRRQGHGHIVNVAAVAGIAPEPGLAAYNAAEAALIAFTETLYAELAPLGLGVTLLCPAWFRSRLGDGMRAADPVSQARFRRRLTQGDVPPETLARLTLDAVDKGEFRVLPPGDARRAWWRARLRPGRLLSDMVALGRRYRR